MLTEFLTPNLLLYNCVKKHAKINDQLNNANNITLTVNLRKNKKRKGFRLDLATQGKDKVVGLKSVLGFTAVKCLR